MGLKKRDDEKLVTLLVCGLFSAVFIACLLFAKNLAIMGVGLWVLLIAVILCTAYSWFVVVKNIYDPNYDKWRAYCIVLAIVGICIVMGHRAAVKGDIEFWKEVEENKIENAAP